MSNLSKLNEVLKGGAGSGDHGHSGRPGKRGGSSGGSGGGSGFSGVRGKLTDGTLKMIRGTEITDPFSTEEVVAALRKEGWTTSGTARGDLKWVATKKETRGGHDLHIAHNGQWLSVTLDGEAKKIQ